MLHPRFTNSAGLVMWAAQIGPYGSWGDLTRTTRWGTGACGNFEATFTMPLPTNYEHPLLRRGVKVELMDGNMRVGSSFQISQIARGAIDKPWTITCDGIGRLVEGRSSYYAFDGSGNVTATPSTAIDAAIARGLPWAGREAATVPTTPNLSLEEPVTVGELLTRTGEPSGNRWGVWDADLIGYRTPTTTPIWQVLPQSLTLGVADDAYATVVYVRFTDSGTGTNLTVHAPSSAPAAESQFERQEDLVLLTDRPAMSAAAAQAIADGIYARTQGRLALTDRMTLTSNELTTIGGQPADLSMVEAGDMVRMYGVSNELLEFNGLTYLDFIIGEAKYPDGAKTIDVAPAGLAARDIAAIQEDVTGMVAT